MSEILVRPARPQDKDAVLGFTQATFDWGDYIVTVWDDWLAQPGGELSVAECGGVICGLSMTTMLASREGWLQGLRVHPDFRRMGLARTITNYQLDLLRRWGAPVVRLAVHCRNVASQTHVARMGFSRLTTFVILHRKSASVEETAAPVEVVPAAEAGAAWQQIGNGPARQAAAGLWARGWTWQKLTREIVEEHAAQGAVVGVRSASSRSASRQWDALALIAVSEGDTHLGYVDGTGAALGRLATAMAEQAKRQGRDYCSAMLPPAPEICSAFRHAGFAEDGEGAGMYIYELALG